MLRQSKSTSGKMSLPNDKNFTLVEIESICRQQNKWYSKLKFVFGSVENIVGKENADNRYFSFPHNFFKKLLFKGRWLVGWLHWGLTPL